jgi:hypothetical protein
MVVLSTIARLTALGAAPRAAGQRIASATWSPWAIARGLAISAFLSTLGCTALPAAAQVRRGPEPLILDQPQPAVATIRSANGKINVKLVNRTNALIRYQAIPETQERSLPRVSTYTLQQIDVPSYLTFYREDRGFLRVKVTAEGNQLTLMFDVTDNFGTDRTSLEVRADGKVFLN